MRKFPVREKTFLQDFLLRSLPDLKKTRIKQILKFGSVRVNGREVTWYKHPLNPGDTVEILGKERLVVRSIPGDPTTRHLRIRRKDAAERSEVGLGFPVLYEDDALLVAEKPAGLLTMGTEREKEATLYFMLTDHVRSRSRNGKGRIFIVHRLDRDASGLVVFAKTETVKRTLQDGWKLAVKKYYAVTEGAPAQKTGTVRNYLREDDFMRVYRVPQGHPGAKQAITHYRVLREKKGYALCEVTLETGRKNQIRVHLAGLGCPIAGDKKYGAVSDPAGRLALHAFFLSFPHPMTGEVKTFETRLPRSFQKLFPAP